MKQKNVLVPSLFIKQGNPESNIFVFLNFTFLSFIYFDYDFQKWCRILTKFISGSPKWGVTDDVHGELNLRTAVAELLVIAITPAHPAHCGLNFPALVTELSGKLANWSVRFFDGAQYCSFPQNVCHVFLLSCSDFLRGGKKWSCEHLSFSERSRLFRLM